MRVQIDKTLRTADQSWPRTKRSETAGTFFAAAMEDMYRGGAYARTDDGYANFLEETMPGLTDGLRTVLISLLGELLPARGGRTFTGSEGREALNSALEQIVGQGGGKVSLAELRAAVEKYADAQKSVSEKAAEEEMRQKVFERLLKRIDEMTREDDPRFEEYTPFWKMNMLGEEAKNGDK